MPAIIRCPNGCKLQVPVRKLFDSFQCPRCSKSLFVAQSQIDIFEKNRKHVLEANLSTDLVEISSADIIYLEGESADLLVEIVDEQSKDSSPQPPPVVDQTPSDAVFAGNSASLVQPETPRLKPAIPNAIPEKPGQAQPSKSEIPPLPASTVDTESNQAQTPVAANSVAASQSKVATRQPARNETTATLDSSLNRSKDSKPNQNWLMRWLTHPDNPGVEHHVQNRWKAYSLGWAMVVIGVLLLGPVLYTMLQWIGKDYHMPLGRWSFLLIFFAAIQFLYALFLFHLPDWSSTRFVSYLMLLMTVMSSFMLAIAFLSQEVNNFFNFLQLSVTSKQLVCSWLTVMSIGFGLMSYLCGRTTQIWMDEEKRLSRSLNS